MGYCRDWKADIERNRLSEPCLGDAVGLGLGRQIGSLGLEVERVERQLQGAALGPHQQRRGVRPCRQLLGTLTHNDVEPHRQIHDKRNRGNQNRRLDAVVGEIAPR